MAKLVVKQSAKAHGPLVLIYDNCNNYGTLTFSLTQYHMELEISKGYFSYIFYRIPSKLYEASASHGGIQAIHFLGKEPSFTKCMALTWELMRKPKKCGIFRKRLIVDGN